MGGLLLMMAILPSSIAFYRVQQRRDLEWRRRLWFATARWRACFQEKKNTWCPIPRRHWNWLIWYSVFFSLFILYYYLLFIPSVLVIENVRNKKNAIVILITVVRISPYSNPFCLCRNKSKSLNKSVFLSIHNWMTYFLTLHTKVLCHKNLSDSCQMSVKFDSPRQICRYVFKFGGGGKH